ncbi:ABC transporter substrate-binding protein [Arthrobacter sp. AZCC_0090]|uniref:ABC transporter substrate-binding protein n=1 Tax=Arthrobacter sp. AZCC_0090 TaxID=2735881 RepID=UPI0017F6944B|nr:extracellular solute-binding protein [Arthrobacter sp. AZCC_0090]MBB6403694.1 raffinose/stachyose/melibiose transport system substrate-binding protein [Arthrobacter sp. AZCC_0090]
MSFSITTAGRARRLAAAALVTAAAMGSLVGCSSSSSASDGPTTISLSMQNPDVKTADPATWAIIQAFEKANPNVKVEVTGEAVAEHLQKLSIAAQSDTLPDVFWVYKSNAEDMLKGGKLMNLSPVLSELGLSDKFPKSTVSNFTSGDAIYGVPYQGLLTGLWYNKKILQDNGLQVPVTFDDLLAVAKKLKEKGITTISNGANQSAFSVWSFLTDLDRFGYADKIDGILNSTGSFNNADFLRLYQHIAELRDAGAFASNVSTQTYQQAVDQFTSGKAAMLDAGVWGSSAIQKSSVAGNVGFWAGPQFKDGVGNQNIIMNVASAPLVVSAKVSKDNAKLAAVKKFIAFYYGDEAQQMLVDNGQPPVTTYKPKVDPSSQSALRAALDAASAPGVSSPESQPDLLVSTPVANAMYDSIYGVIQNQLTPQQAVDLVQAAVQSK